MKGREIVNLGVPQGPGVKAALEAAAGAMASGMDRKAVRQKIKRVVADPVSFRDDAHFSALAEALAPRRRASYAFRDDLDYAVWGDDIDEAAHEQMRNACRLPVATAAALMPDAHVGYGLPIGGVLATENAVIPYAVGVDIACRVKLTVFDRPAADATRCASELREIIERNTRFGVGAAWEHKAPHHEVMDDDWRVTPVTGQLRDLAWRQLGTSGSGNHFVEFGEIEFTEAARGVEAGRYLAVLSHSGSRGPGSRVAGHYSRLAMEKHADLPKSLRHLAWLSLDEEGAEYWAAMELMGRYASANHAVIHDRIAREVGGVVLTQVENHHNFAWRETHDGREVIVHRKGATPASKGASGFIPGSMTAPGYLVEGLGDPASLDSASHGAGRRMSRSQARQTTRWSHLREHLSEAGVTLISAGLDESPHAYKDIESVLDAQSDLVRRVAKFTPRVVKMAPDGEKPED